MEAELDRLKDRLLAAELARTTNLEMNVLLRRAANDAVALVWLTPFPLLLLARALRGEGAGGAAGGEPASVDPGAEQRVAGFGRVDLRHINEVSGWGVGKSVVRTALFFFISADYFEQAAGEFI
jgi:hypothetical protein